MDIKLIRYVDGQECPCPSSFNYGLMDVSSDDAGRVQDDNATMFKNRICQKRKIDLVWNGPTPEQVSKILTMFNPEYIQVTYFDAMDGIEETRTFYVGDRTAPVHHWIGNNKRYTTVSFNIIER